jgi:hypothetical protein
LPAEIVDQLTESGVSRKEPPFRDSVSAFDPALTVTGWVEAAWILEASPLTLIRMLPLAGPPMTPPSDKVMAPRVGDSMRISPPLDVTLPPSCTTTASLPAGAVPVSVSVPVPVVPTVAPFSTTMPRFSVPEPRPVPLTLMLPFTVLAPADEPSKITPRLKSVPVAPAVPLSVMPPLPPV